MTGRLDACTSTRDICSRIFSLLVMASGRAIGDALRAVAPLEHEALARLADERLEALDLPRRDERRQLAQTRDGADDRVPILIDDLVRSEELLPRIGGPVVRFFGVHKGRVGVRRRGAIIAGSSRDLANHGRNHRKLIRGR